MLFAFSAFALEFAVEFALGLAGFPRQSLQRLLFVET